jgi:Na+/H+ antiporter NhaC
MLLFGLTLLLSRTAFPIRALWPVVVALTLVILTRKALYGLLLGAFAGAVLLKNGNLWQGYLSLFSEHLSPSLSSSWKVGAIAFTLILGGFASILDAGGGFRGILHRLLRDPHNASRRFQLGAYGLGLICFFDGLANSMMVGRICRELAPKCGVSRLKLAYIVDSTSSAVACIAFVSTWIAYQLSMIHDSYQLAGRDVNAYLVFLHSIPYNYYCWFTLVLLLVSILRHYNPGAMQAIEEKARAQKESFVDSQTGTMPGSFTVLIPLAVLLISFFFAFYLLGCSAPLIPVTLAKVAESFGSNAGPLVMVTASLLATLTALLLFPKQDRDNRLATGLRAFWNGVESLIAPIFILVAAWLISSVLQQLKTAEVLASLLPEHGANTLLPSLVFLIGATISFSCGSSWGTMGILFPLAIPIAAATSQALAPAEQDHLLLLAVAAVFSGAVFGDHCSPFSDTTIVSSISSGVEPHDHIRTQLPFAFIGAGITLLLGFLPAGFGIPAYFSLPAGALALWMLPRRTSMI